MKQALHLFLTTFLLLSCSSLHAHFIMEWKRFTPDDGLSHRTISSIEEDSIGGIWMATWNGICHYNGTQFATYNTTADGYKLGRLIFVRPLSDGNLWCLTQNNKIPFLYNPQTKEVKETSDTRIIRQGTRGNQIKLDSIGLHIIYKGEPFCIPFSPGNNLRIDSRIVGTTDSHGTMWVNFEDALYRITFSPAPFRHIREIDTRSLINYDDELRSILYYPDGRSLWAAKDGIIYQYDSSDKLAGTLHPDEYFPTSDNTPTKVYAMLLLGDTCWLGSKGNGLFRLTAKNDSCYDITHHSLPTSDSLTATNIYDLLYTNGELWFATWGTGIWKSTLTGGIPTNFQHWAPGTKVRAIEHFNQGIAAATTYGIYLFDTPSSCQPSQIGNIDATCIHQNSDGKTYVGTMGMGLYLMELNKTTGEYTLVPHTLPGIGDIIFNIIETPDKQTWFICDNTLIRRMPDGTISKFDKQLFGEQINFSESMPVLADDCLWIGTTIGRFYIRTDLPHAEAIIYTPNKKEQEHLWLFLAALTAAVICGISIFRIVKRTSSGQPVSPLSEDKNNDSYPVQPLQEATSLLSPEDQAFKQAVYTYVIEHLGDSQISVDNIAESIGTNRTTFYQRVKSVFGTTPATLILDIRIEHAIKLLQAGKHTPADIAYMVGFSEARYFYQVFKKKTGITPKQFSEKLKNR